MSHDLKKQVVAAIRHIRRENDLQANWIRLRSLMDLHLEEISTGLSARWIKSICDTYADHGTPIEQRNALLISLLLNMIRLADTSRLIRGPVDEEQLSAFKGDGRTLLFSELRTLDLDRQDSLLNLTKRLDRQIRETPQLHRLYLAVLTLIHTSENTVSEFRDLSAMPERVFPLEPHNLPDNNGVTHLGTSGD